MHKIINDKAPKYLSDKIVFQGDYHTHQTKYRDDIRCSKFKTNFGRNCFFNNIGKKYNETTRTLNLAKSLSIGSFKSKLKNHFLNS